MGVLVASAWRRKEGFLRGEMSRVELWDVLKKKSLDVAVVHAMLSSLAVYRRECRAKRQCEARSGSHFSDSLCQSDGV